MVRLLERLWDFRNRGVDTPRSPSQSRGRLRALTQPGSPALGARRSCRLQLEPLEDRLTPSGLDFVPVAHVAVNPQPLPPQALVEFDPLPGPSILRKAGGEQIKISGALSKVVTPIGTGSTPGDPWFLQVFYNLNGSDTVTIIPPDPFTGQEGISATYSLAGTLTEILAPVAPTTGATWVFNGMMTEQGTFNGAISPPDPATGMTQVSGAFADVSTDKGVWAAPSNPAGPQSLPWNFQATSVSAGVLQIQDSSALGTTMPSAVASFWQQDQVSACYMPVPLPFHPPQPCITIDAVFNTWGQEVIVAFEEGNPDSPISVEVDTGTTQYTDQLAETIMMPDGSTQTLTQTSMDMGSFVGIIIEGG